MVDTIYEIYEYVVKCARVIALPLTPRYTSDNYCSAFYFVFCAVY